MKMNVVRREGDEDVDVDQKVLDRILNKLYDFGDAPDNKRSKKKRKKRMRITQEEEEEDVEAPEETFDKLVCKKGRADVSRETVSGRDEESSGFASSSCERSQRSAATVEIVRFQDPLKKNKMNRAVEKTQEADEGMEPKKKKKEEKKEELDVLTMEKARLDVHRFGITGYQKQQQRVFEQDRAIMLGARPPKKDYINYKVYQQMIKERKSKEEEDKPDTQKKKKKSPGNQKNVKRKSGSSGGELTGHMGHFKNGMLVLSSKDIQKLNSKVRK